MRADGLSRAIRRIVCRPPWSALAVTEHVLTMTTSASEAGAFVAPPARSCSSKCSESTWLTRHPNVTIEYFTMAASRVRPTVVESTSPELERRPAALGALQPPCRLSPRATVCSDRDARESRHRRYRESVRPTLRHWLRPA